MLPKRGFISLNPYVNNIMRVNTGTYLCVCVRVCPCVCMCVCVCGPVPALGFCAGECPGTDGVNLIMALYTWDKCDIAGARGRG